MPAPDNVPNYAALIHGQDFYTVDSFTLESGVVLRQIPVAYKTWGVLNERRDNVMIICHAFTGSSDVEDWWGPLIGIGKAFDHALYFIVCANVMGSPYGSASPVTTNPDTGKPYGPEFPSTTIRDDVRLHKLLLDHLGVQSVAVAVGGSMGGMAVLEWPLCTPQGYVRHIIPIATSARHSAWCISWSEAQRQSIYSDPAYADGYYTPGSGPHTGLAAARMAALLTYRSRDSFESRFGRKPQRFSGKKSEELATPPLTPLSTSPADVHVTFHNEGHRLSQRTAPTLPIYSAQSYLRYQGDKFNARFDANCYIHITRKMDTHDVARGRLEGLEESTGLARILSTLPPGALVIGIETDGLFMPSEQREIAERIPGAELAIIPSPDGHDGFLLEFEQINGYIMRFLKGRLPEVYEGRGASVSEQTSLFEVTRTSTFGEAEVDVTMW